VVEEDVSLEDRTHTNRAINECVSVSPSERHGSHRTRRRVTAGDKTARYFHMSPRDPKHPGLGWGKIRQRSLATGWNHPQRVQQRKGRHCANAKDLPSAMFTLIRLESDDRTDPIDDDAECLGFDERGERRLCRQ
jgi:hypothetical protein